MRAAASVLAVLVSTSAAFAQSTVDLYRRVAPLEATTGVVSIGESLSVRIDVPEGESQRFARVYRIAFEVETRWMTNDTPLVERKPRGTAYLALAMVPDDEERYDELLREALAALGASTFDDPLAGLLPMRPPFGTWIAERAVEPSWACFDRGDGASVAKYHRSVDVAEDGTRSVTGSHSTTYRADELVEPLCASLAQATQSVHLEEIRTMATPRLLIEGSLVAEVTDMLPETVYGDRLVPLPERASLGRRKRPGVMRSTSLHSRDGTFEAMRTTAEVETRAVMTRAELPAAAARDTVWHARWSFAAVERRMGPRPESRAIGGWSLTTSLMPTVPPRDMDDEEGARAPDPDESYATRIDEDAWFDAVADSLDGVAEITPDALAATIVDHIDGLGDAGWILVICMPDGGATWGLPPTTGRATLINRQEFCSTVESFLP